MDTVGLFASIVNQAWAGDPKWIVELRRSLAANPELVHSTQDDGSTPLHRAFPYRFLVEELLSHGANVDARNHAGLTPLCYAAKWVRADVIEVLIEHGAEVNVVGEDGKTPLHWAVARGRSDVVRMLIEAGADKSIQDSDGRSPLAVAEGTGKEQVAELLRLSSIHVSSEVL